MSEGTKDKDIIIAGLIESNDILRGELEVSRNTARLLRRVNSALRGAITSLRNQIQNAQANDELFKQLCNGEFDAATETGTGEGVLPEAEPTVEPAV